MKVEPSAPLASKMDKSKIPSWAKDLVFLEDPPSSVTKEAPEIYNLLERGVADDPPNFYDMNLYTSEFRDAYDKAFHHWMDMLGDKLGVDFAVIWSHETKCYGLNPMIIRDGCKMFEQEAMLWENKMPK